MLAGEKPADEITLNPLEWYRRNEIRLRVGVRIVDVDAERKTVTTDDGSVIAYDTLLLATGSSAFMPPIAGLDKDGVFAFRTLDDTRALLERAAPGVRAVVIGGGLLGLEAARGLQVQGCDVTVVHLMSTLMERQLDPDGGNYLAGKMEDLGVRVLLRRSTTAILGDEQRRRRGVRGRHDRSRPTSSWSPPASGRTSSWPARPASRSTAASSSTTTWRPRIPTSSPSASASSTAASATGWWRRCSSRARCWRRRSPATKGPTYTGTIQAAKLKIMGVDVFSAGDWSEQRARSRCDSRIARSASTRS